VVHRASWPAALADLAGSVVTTSPAGRLVDIAGVVVTTPPPGRDLARRRRVKSIRPVWISVAALDRLHQ